MSLSSIFDNFKTSAFNKYKKGLGDMLLITGTVGWILSSAGQLLGIATNDKLSGDQKKFLIPQEMADAAINIASFYFVTRSIKNLTKSLASSGKITTKEITKFCTEHGIKIEKGIGIGSALSKKVSELQATLNVNKERKLFIDSAKLNKINNEIKEINDFSDNNYSPFEGGLEVLGSVIGAVISSNIITPIIRNPIAAYKQKQAIAQERVQKQLEQQQTLSPYSPTLPMQNKLNSDNYKAKTMQPTGGNMKI